MKKTSGYAIKKARGLVPINPRTSAGLRGVYPPVTRQESYRFDTEAKRRRYLNGTGFQGAAPSMYRPERAIESRTEPL